MTRVNVDPGRMILIARCFFAAREGTRRANKIRFEWRSFTVENHHRRLTSLRVQQRVSGFSILNVYRMELRHKLSILQPFLNRSVTIENITLVRSLSHQLLSFVSVYVQISHIKKKIFTLYIDRQISRIALRFSPRSASSISDRSRRSSFFNVADNWT